VPAVNAVFHGWSDGGDLAPLVSPGGLQVQWPGCSVEGVALVVGLLGVVENCVVVRVASSLLILGRSPGFDVVDLEAVGAVSREPVNRNVCSRCRGTSTRAVSKIGEALGNCERWSVRR